MLLAEEQTNNDGPYQMAVPTIRDSEYDDGELKVYLDGIDPVWFVRWFDVLRQGGYNHSYSQGFGPINLRKYPPDCIAMPVSASAGSDTLKSIAQHLKSWIPAATGEFNREQQKRYAREEDERRQKKEAEIKRLKKEAEMREAVKGLFD